MSGITIKKVDTAEEQRMVWAEVYAPDRLDAGKDFATAEEIRKAAYNFVRSGRLTKVDVMHGNKGQEGVQILETFIARDNDPDFIPGSWVVGIHIPDDALWAKVKKGEINGLSMEALAMTQKVALEVDIPPLIVGTTSKDAEHVHKFYVSYDDQGNFKGGYTDEVDGHKHVIKAGTVTETVNDHNHKFSSVDNLSVVR
jgi:hypothetical protein